uniref:Uncharacterized protein n=2 Tax=Phaeomonas parva TaxID=124430 RepID=A0A7S1XZ49_9STRA|mmetsp:Transcript_45985/g.143890  ORF Transcript_45985/g.143890 Transcript_45985/m.143890 type:complete len:166 (+) Transcript_45985:681-1178(+)
MQTARGRNPLPYVILNEVLAESGYKGLYRGWEAYLFLCWRPAVQYAIYDQLKALLLKAKRRKELTSAEAFLLGAVSRAIATIILFPYARAKVVAQAGKNASADRPEEERASASMVSVLVQIYRDEGVPGLFQGLGPELVRGVFSAALMLMVKEKLTASVKRALLG